MLNGIILFMLVESSANSILHLLLPEDINSLKQQLDEKSLESFTDISLIDVDERNTSPLLLYVLSVLSKSDTERISKELEELPSIMDPLATIVVQNIKPMFLMSP
jgi:hypothetical protein